MIGSTFEYFRSLPGTNDYLRNLETVSPGHVVVTDLQTAGRGRGGHRWEARAGENLLFSFCITVATADSTLSLLPVLISLSVCEAVDPSGMLSVRTKWPNDVVCREKKLCGILIESGVRGSLARVVVGIGLNVNQREFLPEIEGSATSLALLTGVPVDREILLGKVIDELNRVLFHVKRAEAVRRYMARCTTIGRLVSFDYEGNRRIGDAIGIDELGRLLIREAEGVRVYSGSEVTHLRSHR